MSKIEIDSKELLKLLKYAEIGANIVAILGLYSGIEITKKDSKYVSRGIYSPGTRGESMIEVSIAKSLKSLRSKSRKFKKFKKIKTREVVWEDA